MMFFSIAEFVVLLLALALEVFAQTYPPNDDGVINPLGLGQDPAPVRWYNTTSKQNVYLFPDVDFNRTVWLRVSTNLSDVQYDLRGNSLSLSPSHGNPYGCLMKLWTDHTVFVFPNSIATEAPDISQTADKKWVMYISAVSLNYIFVIKSDTSDPLGTWSSYGNVEHNGQLIQGYDAHAVNLPDGRRYLTWSTSFHADPSISLIQLQTVNSSIPGTALTKVVIPYEPYEQTQFGPGNYSYLGMQCCDAAANVFNAPVVEAPCSWVVNNETVNLGYSANWYADSTYNLLITTASASSNLLNASSWTKSPYNPILSSNFYTSTYGPGSGGFFTGPDDDLWFAYGATNNNSLNGFTGGANIRTVRAQKMGYDGEGRILRSVPVNATRPIAGSNWGDYPEPS